MNTNDPSFELIRRCRDGEASTEELAQLESCVCEDAAFRQAYVRYINVDVALSAVAKTVPMPATSMTTSRPHRNVWLQWRPLTAAAAGMVVGLFCASVVFAYVAPSLGKAVTLLDDSFESGPAPLVTGVPVEPSRWSGDYTEIVGEQQGVKPENGKKMLRLLRGDYERKTNAEESHVADIYRLIDVRSHRQEFADGSAVVQLAAAFNAFEFPSGEIYSCRMTIHAFDAATVGNGILRKVSTWDENCLATASTGAVRLDRNPATWQRRTSDLRPPANTDFLLIHLMISAGRGNQPGASFGGHYIDDVRLTMHHSPLR